MSIYHKIEFSVHYWYWYISSNRVMDPTDKEDLFSELSNMVFKSIKDTIDS